MNSSGCNTSRFLLGVAIIAVLFLPALAHAQGYLQTNLVSNNSSKIPAAYTDSHLVNPWGLVQGPTTPFWVSDQVTNVSTLYTGSGMPVPEVPPLVVSIPTVGTGPVNGPTGIVFNPDGGFLLPPTSSTNPALFIFANLNGEISGWDPMSTGGLHSAVTEVTSKGAVYTGLAINATGSLIYAADFTPRGHVNVFDSSWASLGSLPSLPSSIKLPHNYEPYNVADINGTLFIAYDPIHVHGSDAGLPVLGSGHGAVIEYNPTTMSYTELIGPGKGDGLDVPWGFAMAPSTGFGKFSGDLLVGDFGSGWISAYSPSTGKFLGYLDSTSGKPITDGGLWTLVFGNGAAGTSTDTLYITAGITQPLQTEGLLAAINNSPEPSTFVLFGLGALALALGRRRRLLH